MSLKVIVIIMFLLIGYNLFSGLYHLMKGNKNGPKVVKALTWRVGLSILLFLLIMLGFYTGVIVRAPA